jgi:hypothetical protein
VELPRSKEEGIMNGLYNILLALICIGAVFGFLDAVSLFDGISAPQSPGITISETQVTSFQSGAESQTANDFSIWSIISMFMKGMGTWIKVVFLLGFVVYDIITQIGCPTVVALPIAALIQLPTNFITFVGLYEWWTGRSLT